MVAAVAALCEALDAHIELMETLVQASQRQHQALLGYRTLEADSASLLEALNLEIDGISEALGAREARVRELTTHVATTLRLPEPRATTLRQLTGRLPHGLASALARRASCLRALTSALVELAQLNQAHAQRGLQLVSAWSALMSRAHQGAQTYTSRGRRRALAPAGSGSVVLSV